MCYQMIAHFYILSERIAAGVDEFVVDIIGRTTKKNPNIYKGFWMFWDGLGSKKNGGGGDRTRVR
jgi:hypothetical protein